MNPLCLLLFQPVPASYLTSNSPVASNGHLPKYINTSKALESNQPAGEKYFSGVRDKPLNRYPVFQKLGNYCSRLEKTHFTCYQLLFQRSFALVCACASFVSRAAVAAARLITTLPLFNVVYTSLLAVLYQSALPLLSLPALPACKNAAQPAPLSYAPSLCYSLQSTCGKTPFL